MKKWLGMLGLALTACGQQVELSPDVALTHQHDAAFRAQVALLQAEQVRLAAPKPEGTGPAVLALDVLNPRHQPESPDTLRQRMRKLAHLVVIDLARPERYQVVNAQVTNRPGRFERGNATSQAFIYPVAGLR